MLPRRFAPGRFGGVNRLPGHQIARAIANNFGGDMRQALLDGAPLRSPLTHSLIPDVGSNLTISATRSGSSETGLKLDPGGAGLLQVTGLADEAMFPGAMRIRNLFPATEDFTDAGWSKSFCTAAKDQPDAPDGTSTAQKITATATNAVHAVIPASGVSGGGVLQQQARMKIGTVNYGHITITDNTAHDAHVVFDLVSGTASAVAYVGTKVTSGAASITADPNDPAWWLCTLTVTVDSTITVFGITGPANSSAASGYSFNAAGTEYVYAWHPALVDITGETDQTTPRPYVSVGVLSAPWHGCNVDAVECFPYDLDGNPIPAATMTGITSWPAATNVCPYSNAMNSWTPIGMSAPSKDAVGPDGAISAFTIVDDSAVAAEYLTNSALLTAATYTLSQFIKKTTGALSGYPALQINSATHVAGCTVDTSNGTATVWTAYTGLTVVTSSAVIEDYNTDFWRVKLTFAATAAAWTWYGAPAFRLSAMSSTGTNDVSATNTAVMSRTQLELGTAATPYIDVPGAGTATRNAWVASYLGGDIANYKSIKCEFVRPVGVSAVGVMAAVSVGAGTDYFSPYMTNATLMTFDMGASAAISVRTNASNSYVPGTVAKAAMSVATNDTKMSFNGVGQTPDTVCVVPVVTQLNIGHLAGALQLGGSVGGIYGWTRNLSQSELNAVSTL